MNSYLTKMDILEEMEKFLETYNLLRLYHEKVDSMEMNH